MKKLMLMFFAVALMMSVSAFGQDTTKGDDMKTESAKSEKMSPKTVHIVGKVGDDGRPSSARKIVRRGR